MTPRTGPGPEKEHFVIRIRVDPIRLAAATAAFAAAVLLLSSCAPAPATARRELTQRERDSTLGKSVLPGAGVVTRALQESDRAAAAAQQLDQQVESEGH